MKKVPKINYRPKKDGRERKAQKSRRRGGVGRRRKTKGLGLTRHGCVRSEVFTTLNV